MFATSCFERGGWYGAGIGVVKTKRLVIASRDRPANLNANFQRSKLPSAVSRAKSISARIVQQQQTLLSLAILFADFSFATMPTGRKILDEDAVWSPEPSNSLTRLMLLD
jgi:hypothetical protein